MATFSFLGGWEDKYLSWNWKNNVEVLSRRKTKCGRGRRA
jgi:hypothetical protein